MTHIRITSLRAQTALHGVVPLRYQHDGGIDNKVPQLHALRLTGYNMQANCMYVKLTTLNPTEVTTL